MFRSSSGYSRQSSKGSVGSRVSRLTDEDHKQIDADIIAIIFAIVLQDIPFICLRLTLIVG